jgi:hypothetical protein
MLAMSGRLWLDIFMSAPEDLRSQNLFPEFGITENEKFMLEAYQGKIDGLDSWVTPGEAQKTLQGLGYDASLWERVVREKIGSHDIRSLAIIALGNEARIQYVIYANLRVIDHYEGWPPLRNNIGIGPTLQDEAVHTEALRQAQLRAEHSR